VGRFDPQFEIERIDAIEAIDAIDAIEGKRVGHGQPDRPGLVIIRQRKLHHSFTTH